MKVSLTTITDVDMSLPSGWFWVEISRYNGKFHGIVRKVVRLRETKDNQLVDDILQGNPNRMFVINSSTKSIKTLIKSVKQKIQCGSYQVIYLRDIMTYPPTIIDSWVDYDGEEDRH